MTFGLLMVAVSGAFLQSLAGGTAVIVIGRMIIGVGVASAAAPLYAAEMATHRQARAGSCRRTSWRSRWAYSWPTSPMPS